MWRLFVIMALGAAWARVGLTDDREDVARVINEYRIHEESGDMIAQGRLMTNDRVMMYVGDILTGDNRRLMQEQQEYMDAFRARFPGVKYEIEIRNLDIRLWETTALASFEWYPTRVIPPELPSEKVRELDPPKTPLIMAHVLVKEEDAWKIAFTAFVPPEEARE